MPAMSFTQLNKRKIGYIYRLILVSCTFLWVSNYYLSENGRSEPLFDKEDNLILFYLIAFTSSLIFVGSFFGGRANFYVARRCLYDIISYSVFDNNEYKIEYKYINSRIMYTHECAFGHINGYPTIISVNKRIGRYTGPMSVELFVFIVKFNKTRPERLLVELKYGRLPENVKQIFTNFVIQLEGKGYSKGIVTNSAEAIDMLL